LTQTITISNRLNPDLWDLHSDGEWIMSRHDFSRAGKTSDVENVIDLLTNLQTVLGFKLEVIDGAYVEATA
jgi:hypothetical protein